VGTRRGPIFESVFVVAVAICLALGVQAWAVKPYQIPSGSMEPTLDIGQRVLVNRVTYHLSDPDIGDVVVFHPPAGAENGDKCGARTTYNPGKEACPEPTPEESSENFIKRIVAGPGDRLYIRNGNPIVNGRPIDQTWDTEPCGGGTACNLPEEITIPPDHYFMMGDNRGSSDDSRFWGPVPRDWIIGQAFATYWPPDRLGTL
jgi:signal peptidase I